MAVRARQARAAPGVRAGGRQQRRYKPHVLRRTAAGRYSAAAEPRTANAGAAARCFVQIVSMVALLRSRKQNQEPLQYASRKQAWNGRRTAVNRLASRRAAR